MQAEVGLEQAAIDSFFGTQTSMRASIAILCDSIHCESTKANLMATKGKLVPSTNTSCSSASSSGADPVTQTILMLLSSPVHVQLTVVGWQPLRGRELTFPFHLMTSVQKQALKDLVEDNPTHWNVYEHAMSYRRPKNVPPPAMLSPLDVLGALCSSILASVTYQDKRLRVAVCNILLQRVQASIPIDKQTQSALNARLFPPPVASDSMDTPEKNS
jgi:hypothetical protein